MGFVSRGIILLIKSGFFYILFPDQAQDKNVCARISELDILRESVDRARNKCPLSPFTAIKRYLVLSLTLALFLCYAFDGNDVKLVCHK